VTDYLFDPALYAEGHTFPSSGAVGNTLVQPSKGTGATITALDAAGTGGLRGVRFSTPTGQSNIIQFGPNPEASEVSDNVAWWGEWKVPAATPTNNIIIGGIRGGTGSTSMALFLYTSAGKFALADRNGTVRHTFATSPTPGSWYHCTVGAQRGTTGTAPASNNGLINGAFYPLGNTTPVDTPAALTAQDTGQVASRYARLGGAMVGVTQTTTPYINDARRAGFTTGSSAIIPPTVSGVNHTFNPADTLGLVDDETFQADNGSTSTDPVGLTDTVTASAGRNATRADTLGVTDAATSTAASTRTPGDGAGLTDATAASVAASRGVGDLSGLTDAASPAQGLTRAPADTAGLVDAVTAALSITGTAADALGLGDAVSALIGTGRSATDTQALTDTVTAAVSLPRGAADTAGLGDAASPVQGNVRGPGDTAGVTDAVTPTMVGARGASDAAGITDSVTAELVLLTSGSAADALGLLDGVSATAGATRGPGDTAGLGDAITVTVSRTVVLGDGLGMLDQPGRTMTLDRATTDTLTVTDDIARVSAWELELGDVLGVTDSVFPVRTNPDDLPPDPGDLVVGRAGTRRNPFTVYPPRKA
jgi:hypothetical protein